MQRLCLAWMLLFLMRDRTAGARWEQRLGLSLGVGGQIISLQARRRGRGRAPPLSKEAAAWPRASSMRDTASENALASSSTGFSVGGKQGSTTSYTSTKFATICTRNEAAHSGILAGARAAEQNVR